MFPNNRKQESADCKLPPRFSFKSRLNSLSKVMSYERKERSANLPTALLYLFFLNGYPPHPYIGVGGESPIHLLIG